MGSEHMSAASVGVALLLGAMGALSCARDVGPPDAPVEFVGQACCTDADFRLTNFQGCRLTRGQCSSRLGERFWMRGHVACGPINAECMGRCCGYLPNDPSVE